MSCGVLLRSDAAGQGIRPDLESGRLVAAPCQLSPDGSEGAALRYCRGGCGDPAATLRRAEPDPLQTGSVRTRTARKIDNHGLIGVIVSSMIVVVMPMRSMAMLIEFAGAAQAALVFSIDRSADPLPPGWCGHQFLQAHYADRPADPLGIITRRQDDGFGFDRPQSDGYDAPSAGLVEIEEPQCAVGGYGSAS
jgi:hypothetical protein